MCSDDARPGELWELVLSARPPVLDEFPADLFADDDLVWHRQQLGLEGHLATATIFERDRVLYVTNLVSDVVQRIGRRREHKTRIENRFQGWARLLVSACLDLALDRDADRVLVATSDWALAHTDPNRTVQRALFDRVYDRSVMAPFVARRTGHWWDLGVGDNAATVLRPRVQEIPLPGGPSIHVCHDIERGWGHLDDDPEFAGRAAADAPAHLDRMLGLEAAAGVRATYSVVGFVLPEVADPIRAGGHCLAFHSFDHAVADEAGVDDQLGRCREIDYRLKGYRPAQSVLTAELTDANLAWHNFEWLASSRHSLGSSRPVLHDGVVRIPILFDDFPLHGGVAYDRWLSESLRVLAHADTRVFSLHDCYGDAWLGHYASLLRSLGELGTFRTLDELAADEVLAHAV